jgi:hypothetical protein
MAMSLLEAKHIRMLTYYMFTIMDLTDDGEFSGIKFAGSILGQCLKMWTTLPDSAMIYGLWNQAPLQAIHHWFLSLQSLLSTKQNWVKRLQCHPERAFYHARDAEGKCFLLLDTQVPSNIPGRMDSITALLLRQ